MSTTPDKDQTMLLETLDVEGQRVADIGCGRGGLVRFLRAHGAHATGIECAEQQISAARAADLEHTGDYIQGVAEDLPLPDAGTDIAIFFHSLHHVTPENMATALTETHRILAPGGSAYVVEPVATGPSHELDRLIDDETEVRAAAQAALERADGIGFERIAAFDYDTTYSYRDFDDYRNLMTGIDPVRQARFEAVGQEAEETFQRVGKTNETGTSFDQPNRVVVLRKPG